MGFDGLPSPGNNEWAEITLEVAGAVSPEDFKKFKDALKKCLKELAETEGGKTLTWTRVAIWKRTH